MIDGLSYLTRWTICRLIDQMDPRPLPNNSRGRLKDRGGGRIHENGFSPQPAFIEIIPAKLVLAFTRCSAFTCKREGGERESRPS
jgi:hypothetical protein